MRLPKRFQYPPIPADTSFWRRLSLMKHPPTAPLKPFVLSFLMLLLWVPFLSSCGGGNGVKKKESQQRHERTTPFNEEVDEVRALQERMQ
jgi:hypothetical protein